MDDQAVTALRGQLVDIVSATVFLFMGMAACSIAAIRCWRGVRLLLWLGVWSATYGIGLFTQSPAITAALPHSLQLAVPYARVVTVYVTVVIAFTAFLELCVGKLRLLIGFVIVAGAVVAVAGIGTFVFGGSGREFISYNHLVTICGLVVIVTVFAFKSLSERYLVLVERRILAIGTLIFTVEALWVNLARSLPYLTPRWLGYLAFAVFLLSFGYVALQIVFTNERRLLSIENELEVARQLQFSILPMTIPEVGTVRIAVDYRPMTAVAGDFYDFIPVGQKKIGFLVADVTGHGVPAALIAAMIKVAMQTVVPCAEDPREVLRGLNRALFQQLHGQFVSAGYLWIDTENGKASYSGAGHPPLLRWQGGRLTRIESNGLLFGVLPDPDYPVCELRIEPGDRFLLYTDGLTEPENGNGDPFGEQKLEEVLRDCQTRSPSELSDELFSQIRRWQPASQPQQDDMTLVVIDLA